jgi:hypothetical protein
VSLASDPTRLSRACACLTFLVAGAIVWPDDQSESRGKGYREGMAFVPTVDATLGIRGATYRFLPYPMAANVPHRLEGQEAIVDQVSGRDGRNALKDIQAALLRWLVSRSEALAQLAVLPGPGAHHRIVLNATKRTAALRDKPDLVNCLPMPWIDRPTWWDLLMTKRPLRWHSQIGIWCCSLTERLVAGCIWSSLVWRDLKGEEARSGRITCTHACCWTPG